MMAKRQKRPADLDKQSDAEAPSARARGTAKSVDRPLKLIVRTSGDVRLPPTAAAVLAKIIRSQLAEIAGDDEVA